MEELISLLAELTQSQRLVQIVIHSPLKKEEIQKITIRPVKLKSQIAYHATFFYPKKTTNQNLTSKELEAFVVSLVPASYKQAILYAIDADYHILANKKQKLTILKRKATQQPLQLAHNRQKAYLLEEGIPISFLIELGLMHADGRIIPSKSDKFRQMNRFLELVVDVLPNVSHKEPLHLIDFGCGKAYLTFALYYYFTEIRKQPVHFVGLDLKADVVDFCNQVAKKLGYEHLHFYVGDIQHYVPDRAVDLVVTLHACDTATDAALHQAVEWKTPVILSVPCCQHELFSQIENEALTPLLKHGILRERFAALATDAARAQLLECAGYQTQVIEFIDMEHTPKNLLIRAVKREVKATPQAQEQMLKQYDQFKKLLSITPMLEKLL